MCNSYSIANNQAAIFPPFRVINPLSARRCHDHNSTALVIKGAWSR
jgi:hypothetical protein